MTPHFRYRLNVAAGWLWRHTIRRVIPPPPTSERCVSGSPVHPEVWCCRRSLPGSIWCKRHAPVVARLEESENTNG